jgi:hypothetical protein
MAKRKTAIFDRKLESKRFDQILKSKLMKEFNKKLSSSGKKRKK